MSDLSDQRRYYERMIDEIADAHREQLDQLKAENARLKQELEAVGTAAYLYGRTDIADENAKLRKLCASLYGYAYDENPDGTELNFADDMRELGIEVDG